MDKQGLIVQQGTIFNIVINHNGKEFEKNVHIYATESFCYTVRINTTL